MADAQPTDSVCELPLRSRTCPCCGREFTYRNCSQPGYLKRLDERKRKFCTAACRDKANYESRPCRRLKKHVCERCGNEFASRTPKGKVRFCPACKGKAIHEAAVAAAAGVVRPCKNCQQSFAPRVLWQVFCTRACANRFSMRNKPSSGNWERAMRASFVEPVSIGLLYLRDRGVCQICGGKVPWRLKCPHPDSPSVDHRIALANGGEHSYANTQLAHLRCNAIKSNH